MLLITTANIAIKIDHNEIAAKTTNVFIVKSTKSSIITSPSLATKRNPIHG